VKRIRLAAALLTALLSPSCSRRQAAPPAAADPDEELATTFEEMARIADHFGEDCTRWAVEQGRVIGAERLRGLNDRLRSMSESERAAFHAKYGSRVDPLQRKVLATSARCIDELLAAREPIRVYARPDGGGP
jgi:hypothetical protein